MGLLGYEGFVGLAKCWDDDILLIFERVIMKTT